MDSNEQLYFLSMLRAISDPNRLHLLRLASERGCTVQDIAKQMRLPEAQVSEHLTQLHANGFLRLTMLNQERSYHFKPEVIDILDGYVHQLGKPLAIKEKPVSDNRWLDDLDMKPEEKSILVKWTFNGRLTDMPIKDKERRVVLQWVASKFESGVRYTEKQVNEVIKTHIHPDYATLRRGLIEDGFMKRERGGAEYWLDV